MTTMNVVLIGIVAVLALNGVVLLALIARAAGRERAASERNAVQAVTLAQMREKGCTGLKSDCPVMPEIAQAQSADELLASLDPIADYYARKGNPWPRDAQAVQRRERAAELRRRAMQDVGRFGDPI